MYLFTGIFTEQQVRRVGRLAARHDRQRLGLEKQYQSCFQQSIEQGKSRVVCRERQLLRDGW